MLNKGRTLQKALKQFSELSKPMSLVEVVSAANQANNGNDPRFYRIPKATDLGELALKLPPAEPGKPNLLKGFVDTSFSQMRISYQMKDVGSIRMDSINKENEKMILESENEKEKTKNEAENETKKNRTEAEKAIEKTKNTADEDLNINESEIVEEE